MRAHRNPRAIKRDGVVVGYHPIATPRQRLIAIVRDATGRSWEAARAFVYRATRPR